MMRWIPRAKDRKRRTLELKKMWNVEVPAKMTSTLIRLTSFRAKKEEAILIPKEKLRVESVSGVTRKMKRNMRSLATYS
jgi:hypothetical protein